VRLHLQRRFKSMALRNGRKNQNVELIQCFVGGWGEGQEANCWEWVYAFGIRLCTEFVVSRELSGYCAILLATL